MDPQIRLDIYSILLFISIGQLFISVLYLINNFKKNKSALLLAIILLVFTLNIIEPVLIRTRFLYSAPHFLYIGPFFLLLLGPATYLYMISIKDNKFKWKSIYLLHFAPFLVSKFWRFPEFFKSSSHKKEIILRFFNYDLSGSVSNFDFDLPTLLFMLHPLTYFIIIFLLMFLYSKEHKSGLTKNHFIYVGSLMIIVVFYLFGRPLNSFHTDLYWKILAASMFAFSTYSSYLIISGLLKRGNKKPFFKRIQRLENIYNKVKESMQTQELFLDEEMSLTRLANKLETSPKDISKVVNEFEKKNFSEFINSYRIDKAKTLILDEKMNHFTIEAIAKEVGFSNKMSFNRAFKKHVKMTPTEFKSVMNK